MRRGKQRGAVLLLCMTLLMLLGIFGLSAMQAATQQQRMVNNLLASVRAFESAQALLRLGEARLPDSGGLRCSFCLPPPEAEWILPGRSPGGSGLDWQHEDSGLYLIQNLGPSTVAAGVAENQTATLYRVTAVGLESDVRVVLESIHARVESLPDGMSRRIAWRQIF